ncbi:MAG: hypothetical protein SGJ18_07125 [Pseudomonadota bacterium]|nr:hypothetical protein [Pseudomonadota bacterium]
MKTTNLVILLSLILAVSACNTRKRDRTGTKKSDTAVNKTGRLDYEFNLRGCEAKQGFESNQALCVGLQDSTLNKGCALLERKVKFESDCKGQTFKETNPYAAKPVVTEKAAPKSYSFSDENGCETGKLVFKTTKEMCEALKDNTLNKGCAAEKREQLFKQTCKE